LHTATNDNCPYAVIEAISKKIPALGFDVGGMPEILDRKWLFPVNDFISMASFTRRYADQLPGIASEQFENIRNRFSLDMQLDQVKSVYQSVAKKKQVNLQPV
jgi:glycosyltransferase involved in cell wall biosynthesis